MEDKAISSDLIRGHIDTIILYSLLEGQKTSQQIIDSVLVKSENKYQLNQATLYSSLKRLETLKLISSVWRDADEGRRKFFNLTENGKETVNANLNNWEYSRAIIDKLIGFSESDSNRSDVRVVEVEKIVEKPVYIEKIIEKPTIQTSVNPIKTDDNTEKTVEKSANNQSFTEINFRNTLNGLIKTNEKQNFQSNNQEKISRNETEVKNFNETINDTVKDSFINTANKIDFTDIKEKVEADGYKLSVSSKENSVKIGSIYINKLNLFSALAVCLLGLIEFLIFAIFTKNDLNYTPLAVILPILLIMVLPLTYGIIYANNRIKTSQKLKADGVLYSIIIAFNLILFTIVLNLLLDVNFADAKQLSLYIILPLIIIIDSVIFFAVRLWFSKFNIFIVKKK